MTAPISAQAQMDRDRRTVAWLGAGVLVNALALVLLPVLRWAGGVQWPWWLVLLPAWWPLAALAAAALAVRVKQMLRREQLRRRLGR